MPNIAADIFRQAAELNRRDDRRSGNVVQVEAGAEMIVAGDIHGNRTGLAKILSHAALKPDSPRRLVLQELIHGPVDARSGQDRTVEQLLRAARQKVACPKQTLFLLGNHDISQITGSEITKDGRGVCKAFAEGVRFVFGDDGQDVLDAALDFLRSMPMAIRCPGGVMICHSLPSPPRMSTPWAEALGRQEYRDEDLRRGGGAYEWTWGRKQTEEQIEGIAGQLGVKFFVLGHKHIDEAFEMLSPRAIIVTSEHDHGCVLQFPADETLTGETAPNYARPIVALGT